MGEHPISDLFKISMNSIKEMIDVDTVVGEAVKVNEKVTIIPISKVKCSFATGGMEQKGVQQEKGPLQEKGAFPFGGGTGGNVTISPIAFLVVGDETRVLHLDENVHLYERIIDQVPEAISYFKDIFKKQPTIKNIEVIERK